MMESVKILTETEIKQKINRIACQILEENADEQELYFFGIHKSGYKLAQRIIKCIEKREQVKVFLNGITLNKKNPVKEISFDLPLADMTGKTIIIVDDVANSGKTLTYALKPFLNALPAKIQIAVLVDRKHKRFPINPDFVGLELSTTLQEHVKVVIEKESIEAFLN